MVDAKVAGAAGVALGFAAGYETAATLYADDNDRARVKKTAKFIFGSLGVLALVVGVRQAFKAS